MNKGFIDLKGFKEIMFEHEDNQGHNSNKPQNVSTNERSCLGCRHFDKDEIYCLLKRKIVKPSFGTDCYSFGRRGL
jgi:hypothetical protein